MEQVPQIWLLALALCDSKEPLLHFGSQPELQAPLTQDSPRRKLKPISKKCILSIQANLNDGEY